MKTHPENIATAPQLIPVRHPNAAAKKRAARTARASRERATAGFESEAGFTQASAPVAIEPSLQSEVKDRLTELGSALARAAVVETGARGRESHDNLKFDSPD